MEKRVRIIPVRRKVDEARMAEALLDLVDSLSEEDRQCFAAEGQRLLEQLKGGEKPGKESAA